MALIKCPECGKEVSDKAPLCIHCGFPLKEDLSQEEVKSLLKKEDQKQDLVIDVTSELDELSEWLNSCVVLCLKGWNLKWEDTVWKPFQILQSVFKKIIPLNEKEKEKIYDRIAEIVLETDKPLLGSKKEIAESHSLIFFPIIFSFISERECQKIMDYIMGEGSSQGDDQSEFKNYWYPIQQILKYGSTEQKQAMHKFLDSTYEKKGAFSNSTRLKPRRPMYDQMINQYSKEMKNLLEIEPPVDDTYRTFGIGETPIYALVLCSTGSEWPVCSGILRTSFELDSYVVQKIYESLKTEEQIIRVSRDRHSIETLKAKLDDIGSFSKIISATAATGIRGSHTYSMPTDSKEVLLNKPKCPTCGSTNVQQISGLDRVASTAAWGLASKKINKTFKCNNCGYTW